MSKFNEYLKVIMEGETYDPDQRTEYKNTVNYDIKSSSNVAYDNQEDAWNQIAEKFHISLDELANRLYFYFTQNAFPGVEGLWALTKNKDLFKLTDYYLFIVDNYEDQILMSYIYGGERLEQWLKYIRPIHIDAEKMLEIIKNDDEYDYLEIQPLHNITKNSISFDYKRYSSNLKDLVKNLKEYFDVTLTDNTLTIKDK